MFIFYVDLDFLHSFFFLGFPASHVGVRAVNRPSAGAFPRVGVRRHQCGRDPRRPHTAAGTHRRSICCTIGPRCVAEAQLYCVTVACCVCVSERQRRAQFQVRKNLGVDLHSSAGQRNRLQRSQSRAELRLPHQRCGVRPPNWLAFMYY